MVSNLSKVGDSKLRRACLQRIAGAAVLGQFSSRRGETPVVG